MILAIKTSTADLEQALVGEKHVSEHKAELGRSMAEKILGEIEAFLISNGVGWDDITGLIVFKGPGSFTGLRIGATTANTIAYAKSLPIVGTTGDVWVNEGVTKLSSGIDEKQVIPEYGAAPNITKPRR